MSDLINRPNLTEESLISESGNVKNELMAKVNKPVWRNFYATTEAMGDKSMPASESINTLKNIDLTDIVEFHRRTHVAPNLRFVIVGNFSGDKLEGLKSGLEGLCVADAGERLDIVDCKLHSAKPVVHIDQNAAAISMRILLNRHVEFAPKEWTTSRFLNHILSGNMDSLLFGEVRKRGLAYSLNTFTERDGRNVNESIETSSTPNNLLTISRIIRNGLDKILNDDIDQPTLDSTRTYLIGKHSIDFEIAKSLANHFATFYFYDESINDPKDELERIKSVTKDDIIKMLQSFITQRTWTVGLYGNVPDGYEDKLYNELNKIFERQP